VTVTPRNGNYEKTVAQDQEAPAITDDRNGPRNGALFLFQAVPTAWLVLGASWNIGARFIIENSKMALKTIQDGRYLFHHRSPRHIYV
jgi:hypothetical protein